MSTSIDVEAIRRSYQPQVPAFLLSGAFMLKKGAQVTFKGNDPEIQANFPNTYGSSSVTFVPAAGFPAEA